MILWVTPVEPVYQRLIFRNLLCRETTNATNISTCAHTNFVLLLRPTKTDRSVAPFFSRSASKPAALLTVRTTIWLCLSINVHDLHQRSIKAWQFTFHRGNSSVFQAYITIAIRLRYDDTTTHSTTRTKMNMSIFRPSRVVSQSNRTQIVISTTSDVVECVVVSSYRSRIAIVITA